MIEQATGRAHEHVDALLQPLRLGLAVGAAHDEAVCLCVIPEQEGGRQEEAGRVSKEGKRGQQE